MSKINHQNNFGTNLTSNTTAGDTTSPLNSIPTVDAPFYIAFDATNLNGNYEVLLCTSKTATNVNHAATANAHTTAEEVRMVVPAIEMDAIYQSPRGFLINGKLAVTDAAGITVAIKTLAGNDPSPTDPVYCRIGDTVRSITSALSRALADGTNWMNLGSAELATKEADLFASLVYDSNSSSVGLTWSRIPYANLISDFSATTTNEKYCAGYSDFTTTDEVENIGRFAATLSAGAGYTWTVPTFTASNLIQRPVYETRWLTWLPVYTGNGTLTFTATSSNKTKYKITGNSCFVQHSVIGTTGGTTNTDIYIKLPFTCIDSSNYFTSIHAQFYDAGWVAPTPSTVVGNLVYAIKGSNWGIGTGRYILTQGEYEI